MLLISPVHNTIFHRQIQLTFMHHSVFTLLFCTDNTLTKTSCISVSVYCLHIFHILTSPGVFCHRPISFCRGEHLVYKKSICCLYLTFEIGFQAGVMSYTVDNSPCLKLQQYSSPFIWFTGHNGYVHYQSLAFPILSELSIPLKNLTKSTWK